ncbi:MAG: hypothetical protein U1F71_06570 [Verrucomicrobiaceae bacterium]
MGKVRIDSFDVFFAGGQHLRKKTTREEGTCDLYELLGEGTLSGAIRVYHPAPLTERLPLQYVSDHPGFSVEECKSCIIWADSIDGDYIAYNPTSNSLCLLSCGYEVVRVEASSSAFFQLADRYIGCFSDEPFYYFVGQSQLLAQFTKHSTRIGEMKADEILAAIGSRLTPSDSVLNSNGFIATFDQLETMAVLVPQDFNSSQSIEEKWWMKLYFDNPQLEEDLSVLIGLVEGLGFIP